MPSLENDGVELDQKYIPSIVGAAKTALLTDSLVGELYLDGPPVGRDTTFADLHARLPSFSLYAADPVDSWYAGQNDDGDNVITSTEIQFQADSVVAEPYDGIAGAWLHTPDSLGMMAADLVEPIVVNHPFEIISGRFQLNLTNGKIIFIRSSL